MVAASNSDFASLQELQPCACSFSSMPMLGTRCARGNCCNAGDRGDGFTIFDHANTDTASERLLLPGTGILSSHMPVIAQSMCAKHEKAAATKLANIQG
jgi:hypothetical protein